MLCGQGAKENIRQLQHELLASLGGDVDSARQQWLNSCWNTTV